MILVKHAERPYYILNKTDTWIKKNGDPEFDVTMGRFNGTELCELVDLYILHILGEKYRNYWVGLYRDDRFPCFVYISGSLANKIRKDFIKIFMEDFDLSITCKTSLKAVNFLDTSLNLTPGKYRLYNKPENNIFYFNILSNLLPNIIKNLLGNISKEINTLSSDVTTFNQSKDLYNIVLAKREFKRKIAFQKQKITSTVTNNTQNRITLKLRIKIILIFQHILVENYSTYWVNFSQKPCFPKKNVADLHKLFNRYNFKVSYSSLPKNIRKNIPALSTLKL